MAAQRALVVLADRLGRAAVRRDAGRSLGAGDVGDGVEPAVAVDDGRHGLLEHRPARLLAGDLLADLAAQELLALAHRGLRALGLHRLGVGPVDPFQAAASLRTQNGMSSASSSAEHRLALGDQVLVLELRSAPPSGALSASDRNRTTTCAAVLRPRASSGAPRWSRRPDRSPGISRAARRWPVRAPPPSGHQPAAEGQEPRTVLGRPGLGRQGPDQFRLGILARPDDDALVAQADQRLRRSAATR